MKKSEEGTIDQRHKTHTLLFPLLMKEVQENLVQIPILIDKGIAIELGTSVLKFDCLCPIQTEEENQVLLLHVLCMNDADCTNVVHH